ncbi:hypothetical protein [Nostoc sp.]
MLRSSDVGNRATLRDRKTLRTVATASRREDCDPLTAEASTDFSLPDKTE